jgi:hypothetical protein
MSFKAAGFFRSHANLRGALEGGNEPRGRRCERNPLPYSTINRPFMFGWSVQM